MKRTILVKRISSVLLAVVLVFTMFSVGRKVDAATSAGYVWPVSGGGMNQGYYQAGNSKNKKIHLGLDIIAYYGAPIYAVNNGTVLCASMASASASYTCPTCGIYGAGYHVVIKHADGYTSVYGHMSKVTVSANTSVTAGQKIGEMGDTGDATGPHLHLAMYRGSFSNIVNPLTVISPFSQVYADQISNTGATLHAIFGAYGMNVDSAGFYIGTDPNSLKKYSETLNSNGRLPDGSEVTDLYYSTSKWCGSLRKGTVYYYKIWMKAYDAVYESDLKSFKTSGNCDHVWDNGIVTKEATCGSAGTKTYHCLYCTETRTETIPANGNHNAGSWVTTKSPECTTPGTKVQRCTVCGTTIKTESIDALGHNYKGVVTPPTESSQGYTTYTCTRCGDSYIDDYTEKLPSTDPGTAQAVIEKKIARAGDTVTLQIILSNAPELKSLSISDIKYDTSRLELVKGEWLIDGILASWDPNGKAAAIAFEENTDINGTIFKLTFRVLDDADEGISSIDLTVKAQQQRAGSGFDWITVKTVPGEIEVTDIMKGDFNGDNFIDSEDAIYLLFYSLLPDSYPINQNGDFNHDGYVDSEDAIYLLFYSLIPDQYPLS